MNKVSQSQLDNTVCQILTRVAKEDELLALGLRRGAVVESAFIDQLVDGVRQGIRASLVKSKARQ